MKKSALLLVDIQNDYFPSFGGSKMPLPNMDAAASNAARLLATARETGMLIIHVQHLMPSNSAPFFRPGTPGSAIHVSVEPTGTEKVITKARPNSFVGTDLEDILRGAQIEGVTICGAMTQMCIDATVRAAADKGFKVTLAHDACAAANVQHNGVCQRRFNFPQKCRSKIPHLLGPGDQPALVISGSIPCLWRSPAALRRRRGSDRGVGADMLGYEVGMAAQAVAGTFDLYDHSVVQGVVQ
ncbi:cysteine hydrolase family protein, partial [Leisingera sp. ANG59]|uniref:cysteine hydrolase family protein n=1 Tax=Leisingera sp. ANG59 TaxID=2675221 RepID=UPI0026701ED9